MERCSHQEKTTGNLYSEKCIVYVVNVGIEFILVVVNGRSVPVALFNILDVLYAAIEIQRFRC